MPDRVNILKVLLEQAKALSADSIQSVLIILEVDRFFIGDTCDRLGYLKVCKSIFTSAKIDLFCNQRLVAHLVKGNTYLNQVILDQSYESISFFQYDVVICLSHRENEILDYLNQIYISRADSGQIPRIYSVPGLNDKRADIKFLFPKLPIPAIDIKQAKMEIFISASEREWASQCLTRLGLKLHESLFIVLDAAGDRKKLLEITTYFQLLADLVKHFDARILIYDESGAGKRKLYQKWLGESTVEDRFLFAEKTSLREAICLMSAYPVKMILGPCTGLMHCASAVYQNLLEQDEISKNKLPVLLTYRGAMTDPLDNPYRWWGNSLCDCALIVKMPSGEDQIRLLTDEDADSRHAFKDLLLSQQFTAPLLISFLNAHYGAQLEQTKGMYKF